MITAFTLSLGAPKYAAGQRRAPCARIIAEANEGWGADVCRKLAPHPLRLGVLLAMAPVLLVAQGADVVDLDGPLLLAEDQGCGLHCDAAGVCPPQAELWG